MADNLKNLFEVNSNQFLSSDDLNSVGDSVESADYVDAFTTDKSRFIPPVDFNDPANFAKFGSAKDYYVDAVTKVYKTYPYDGSGAEKLEYANSSSYLDRWILKARYPKSTGYVTFNGAPNNGWAAGANNPDIKEYIHFVGGPGTGSVALSGKPLAENFTGANVYDTTQNRESNLKFDFDQGLTFECWAKMSDLNGLNIFQTLFHLGNDIGDLPGHGRLWIYRHAAGIAASIYQPGAAVDHDFPLYYHAHGLPAVDSWHHYAFSFKNDTGGLRAKTYMDGKLVTNFLVTPPVIPAPATTGSLQASVGALFQELRTTPAATTFGTGWCKMSGSIDEVRYWKDERNAEEVGKYWFTQVNGGSNTDDANTDLGVYYKFNEGITGNSVIDSVALDYSGRVTNGAWTGYDSVYSRNTGSAIVSASASPFEIEDPIIYAAHPDVATLQVQLKESGSMHDRTNNSSIYNSIPEWILAEDDTTLLKLTQIMSSYLDSLYLQIENLPKVKDVQYLVGDDLKPLPYAGNLLDSTGFVSPEMFVDADVLEQLGSRTEKILFEEKLHNIKNLIYQNIYNNLVYIYKSKGTEKAFRNLIRCYGIGDDLVRLNVYADNSTYNYEDNYDSTTVKKNTINFNATNNFNGTIYQHSSSLNANSVSFITGSPGTIYIPRTIETNVFFPKKLESKQKGYFETNFLTASLFGMHTARADDPAQTTYAVPDRANFQVYAIRDEKESKSVRFKLSSSIAGAIPELTTALFEDVYDNQSWNISVRIKSAKYPVSDFAFGTGLSSEDFEVEFAGYNNILDITYNSFALTGTMSTNARARTFLSSSHRVYAGSHLTNFTGAVVQQTDVRIDSLRYWMDYLSDEELKAHARDPLNYGRKHPYRDAYPLITDVLRIRVPQKDTLALNWDFQQVSSSNSSGKFLVADFSSGSQDFINQKYGFLGNVLEAQHPGFGYNFAASDTNVVDIDYRLSAKQTIPENINSSDMVKILDNDDIVFTRDSRPVRHFFAFEKSMYDTISQEMLDMFSTVKDFSNLVGNPVNRYRGRYKDLTKLRNLFFERVENTPSLDKYVEFYKWIDSSLGSMLNQLVPASSDFAEDVRNVVESHALERSKYKTKFPTLEHNINEIESAIVSSDAAGKPLPPRLRKGGGKGQPNDDPQMGGNKLSPVPLSPRPENVHGPYWQRTSDVPGLDLRQGIINARTQQVRRQEGSPVSYNAKLRQFIHGGINFSEDKKLDYITQTTTFQSNAAAASIPASSLGSSSLLDSAVLDRTTKVDFQAITTLAPDGTKGSVAAPFNLVEDQNAVISGDYNSVIHSDFATNVIVTNLHGEQKEIPMQGPFTDAWVGGRQFRHADITVTPGEADAGEKRPEAWRFDFGTSIAATAVDAIDTTGVAASAADCSFTITIPGSLGGDTTGGEGAITILLDADDPGVSPDNGPDQIGLGVQFFSDIDVAAIIIDAINGDVSSYPTRIAFASSGRGQTGVTGITATAGSSNTQITLTMNTVGADGNISSAVADVSGVPVVDITDFTGGETNKKIIFSDPVMGTAGSTKGNARSKLFRGVRAKRPLNIKNIRYTTASARIGNYNKNYQIVMTSGRTTNNLAFVQAGGYSQTTPENYFFSHSGPIPGTLNFALPDQALEDGTYTKTVIANHFNAPGGKDVSSRGVLNPSSEEYAAGNALPWRNRVVRRTLQDELTVHTGQFGTYPYQQYGLRFVGLYSGNYDYIGVNPGTSDSVTALGIANGATMLNYSVSFWLRVPEANVTTGDMAIFAMSPTGASTPIGIIKMDYTDGKLMFSDSTGTERKETTPYGAADNEWHHYVFTVTTAGVLNIYKDGVDVTPTPNTVTVTFAASNTVRIGNRWYWNGWWPMSVEYYNGDLDELAVWNTILSSTEVGSIYNGGDPGDLKKLTGPLANLQAWFRMGDEVSVVHDSARNNVAILNNNPTNGYTTVVTDVPRRKRSLVTGSAQKTNRNPVWRYEYAQSHKWGATLAFPGGEIIKTVSYDNEHVTHPLPRSDVQYRWIRDSYESTKALGFATASNDITFVSIGEASPLETLGIYSNNLVHDDVFAKEVLLPANDLNRGFFDDALILGRSTAPTGRSPAKHPATLYAPWGFPGWLYLNYVSLTQPGEDNAPLNLADYFNILMTSRNGLGGFSTWKQIRTSEHPITRHLAANNYYTYMETTLNVDGFLYKGESAKGLSAYSWPDSIHAKDITSRTERTYFAIEPPVAFNSAPLTVEYVDVGTGQSHMSAFSVVNVLDTFANNSLVVHSNIQPKMPESYEIFLKGFKDPGQLELKRLSLRNTIYPREVNVTLAKVRGRLQYDETIAEAKVQVFGQQRLQWRDLLTNRLRNPYGNWTMSAGGLNSFAIPNQLQAFTGSAIIPAGTMQLAQRATTGASSVYPLDPISLTDAGDDYKAGELLQDTRLLAGMVTPAGNNAGVPGQTYWLSGSGAGTQHPGGPAIGTATHPTTDSYGDFSDNIRRRGVDHTVVPEFRISEHMDYYLSNGFFAENNKFLTGEGFGTSTSEVAASALTETSPYDNLFMTTYTHTDFMKHFGQIRSDYDELATPSKLALKCDVIKKLLPYQGFYPVNRCVQLGTMFSSSHGKYITGSSPGTYAVGEQYRDFLAAATQPLFSPGLLYNSIKSGMAVEWPLYFDELTFGSSEPAWEGWTGSPSHTPILSVLKDPPDGRLKFEDLLLAGYPLNKRMYMPRRKITGSAFAADNTYRMVNAELTQLGSQNYSLAMSNFLAATPEFFLERPFNVFHSKERSRWNGMKRGFTYSMDVSIWKTSDMVQAEGPRGTGSYEWTAGSPYGFMGRNWSNSSIPATTEQDPLYALYTPPYFYGKETVTISVTADEVDQLMPMSIDKIHGTASVSFSLFDKVGPLKPDLLSSVGILAANRQKVTSSVNLFERTRRQNITYDASGTPITISEGDSDKTDLDVWTIATKWECPTLNFSASARPFLSRGMWGPGGVHPTSKQGIYVAIEENPDVIAATDPKAKSLIDICGFETTPQKIGEIAAKKEISEAIVAIPFTEITRGKNKGSNRFIRINQNILKQQMSNKRKTGYAIPDEKIINTSITAMMENLPNYVMPPHLDFIKNKNICNPFVVYLFEFKQELDKDDLRDIWQGVQPSISLKPELDSASLVHKLNKEEFFHGKPLPPDLRWMVFKVKRRASNNYYNARRRAIDTGQRITNPQGNEVEFDFSYNWPYDFCSLVELAKIESGVELKSIEGNEE
jgi:hypothetical protein